MAQDVTDELYDRLEAYGETRGYLPYPEWTLDERAPLPRRPATGGGMLPRRARPTPKNGYSGQFRPRKERGGRHGW